MIEARCDGLTILLAHGSECDMMGRGQRSQGPGPSCSSDSAFEMRGITVIREAAKSEFHHTGRIGTTLGGRSVNLFSTQHAVSKVAKRQSRRCDVACDTLSKENE